VVAGSDQSVYVASFGYSLLTWTWRPLGRPCSFGCTRPNCGSELARDGGLTADQFLSGVHIRCCGNGHLGFRPYGEALFSNAKKVPKKACPDVRPLARARCSFAPAFIWGHRLRSASRRPPLDVFDFVERRYAPAPQMNASTQPADGAGGSRSKAGELPLGLLSGEERAVRLDLLWELACR
jgi:hypothetical protein